MLTYAQLMEVKLGDLANKGKTGTVEKLQKGAHSQGYSISEPKNVKGTSHYTVDVTNRKTGEKIKNTSGGNFGGSHHGVVGKKSETDNTIRHQVKQSIEADRKAKGRVDKRPEAKEKRKAEALANRTRKQKNRNRFTREHTEWWIGAFREEISPKRMAELEAKGKGDAAQKQMEADRDAARKNNVNIQHQGNKEKQKRLNQGQAGMNKGGAIVKREKQETKPVGPSKPMNKSIVKSPKGALAKRDDKGSSLAKTKSVEPKSDFSGSTRMPGDYETLPDKPKKPKKTREPISYGKHLGRAAKFTQGVARKGTKGLVKDVKPGEEGQAQGSSTLRSYGSN